MGPKPILMLLLAGPLAIAGCAESTTEPPEQQGNTTFPSTVGSSWTYRWQDLNAGTTETVTANVFGTAPKAPYGTVALIAVEHPDRTDTLFQAVSGDTVKIESYGPNPYRPTPAWFILPLEVGSMWWGATWIDTTRVEGRDTLTVPAGTFTDAVRIHETWWGFNAAGDVMTWVVPGVGIVKEDRQEYELGPLQHYVRELTAYHIVPPAG